MKIILLFHRHKPCPFNFSGNIALGLKQRTKTLLRLRTAEVFTFEVARTKKWGEQSLTNRWLQQRNATSGYFIFSKTSSKTGFLRAGLKMKGDSCCSNVMTRASAAISVASPSIGGTGITVFRNERSHRRSYPSRNQPRGFLPGQVSPKSICPSGALVKR